MINKLFKFLFRKNTQIPNKTPHQTYKEFMDSDVDFHSLDENTLNTIINYIGIQCSAFVTNDYFVRVTYEDIINHVHRKINIFELLETINNPSVGSPDEIYLGGILWKLDKKKYMNYYNDTYKRKE